MLLANAILPGMIRERAIASVRTRCPQCSLEIGGVDVSVLSGRLSATGIRFRSNPAARTSVNFSATRLDLDVSVPSLLGSRTRVREIEAEAPRVEVVNNRAVARQAHDTRPPLLRLPPALIDAVRVHHGTFVYVQHSGGLDRGVLQVTDIEGRTSSLGTRPGFAPALVELHATARLERSGAGTVFVRADPLSSAGDAHVEVDLRDHSMRSLDDLLLPRNGVSIDGAVDHLRYVADVRGPDLTGTLTGRYHRLDVNLRRGPGRGHVATFILNAAEDFVVAPARGSEADEHSVAIRRAREPGEAMIRSLTRSLIDGLSDFVRR